MIMIGAIFTTSAGLSDLVRLNGEVENEVNVMMLVSMGLCLVDGFLTLTVLFGGIVSICIK